MKRLDVKRFLEGFLEGTPIYPSEFPMKIDKCFVFDFTGNTNREGSLSETQLTVVARSPNIDEAEEMTLSLRKKLDKVTNVDIGDTHAILIESLGKHADYGGVDQRDRYYFQTRFRLLLDDK